MLCLSSTNLSNGRESSAVKTVCLPNRNVFTIFVFSKDTKGCHARVTEEERALGSVVIVAFPAELHPNAPPIIVVYILVFARFSRFCY